MAGGGNSGGVTSFLPIAAALAATVATDGAASPWLVEAMGSEAAAGAVLGAGAGALGGGITAAVTGQNVGKSALMGGLSGATLGYGMAGPAAGGIDSTAAALGGSGGGGALTGANVAGTAAVAPEALTSNAIGYGGTTTDPISGLNAMNGSNWWTEAAPQVTSSDMAGINNVAVDTNAVAGAPGSSSVGDWLSNNKGIAALGGTAALGYLINQDNKKYGVPTPASQQYNGPLTDFHYSRANYTPLVTPQPSPAYQPKYANYVAHPYNAYAAEGGQVVSMAEGGIADANPMQNPSIGPVEQMSRDNAMGQNQMFPQANINSPSFASATNTPMGSNMIAPAGDVNVDPYTGAERFAEGGIANTPQAQPQQAPQGIPLQAMPSMLTQNSIANNNLLAQNLVARMAARNAASPVPGQTPPVVPTGIMAAQPQGYTAPTFTRNTAAPIEFQNPKVIVGTKAYNDEQARLAAEAAAAQQDGGPIGPNPYDVPAGAGGGLMPGALHYAVGGDVSSLGGYAAGGNPRLLKGPGDGMSDNIPATIGGKQPARLADGEFVVPADVVSHLGNGSTDAGAKHLYDMMDKVRKARTGNKNQGKQIKAGKFLKA